MLPERVEEMRWKRMGHVLRIDPLVCDNLGLRHPGLRHLGLRHPGFRQKYPGLRQTETRCRKPGLSQTRVFDPGLRHGITSHMGSPRTWDHLALPHRIVDRNCSTPTSWREGGWQWEVSPTMRRDEEPFVLSLPGQFGV